jgi:uncharacterized protein (DUF302 family)
VATDLPWSSADGSVTEEPATITYSIPGPFQQTLKMLRKVLSARGLKVSGELNVSTRIEQKLLIGTAPCVVLLVSPAAALRKALASDSCAAALAPLHVVVSRRGSQSEVHVLRILPADNSLKNKGAMAVVKQMQAEILQAVGKIGARVTWAAYQ